MKLWVRYYEILWNYLELISDVARSGNITCALTENNLDNNTLFILVSDNGGSGKMDGNHFPFKGGKNIVFS